MRETDFFDGVRVPVIAPGSSDNRSIFCDLVGSFATAILGGVEGSRSVYD